MARGQTQYYGLNQWEAADQVLQTEFNADNQKIDGALKAMRDLIVSPSVLNVVLDKLRADINALSSRGEKLEGKWESPPEQMLRGAVNCTLQDSYLIMIRNQS
ncbi:hypothetical protein [Clostridium phoceensis]|uniref:hypothetical protein n=2 Tax=Clostridium phoceensis TaxID=1650661 RepID=UPI002E78DCB6|nr:hypothetical protein [Clostridium phoceensis]